MGSSFSRITKDFELKLVHDEDSQVLKNADEIMDAIKAARRKIKERLDILESISSPTSEDEREIAVLIRQGPVFFCSTKQTKIRAGRNIFCRKKRRMRGQLHLSGCFANGINRQNLKIKFYTNN